MAEPSDTILAMLRQIRMMFDSMSEAMERRFDRIDARLQAIEETQKSVMRLMWPDELLRRIDTRHRQFVEPIFGTLESLRDRP